MEDSRAAVIRGSRPLQAPLEPLYPDSGTQEKLGRSVWGVLW